MSYSPYALPSNKENGYGWYECNCCPYGYHIDLDFVRYCESIGRQTDLTGSIKRRRDRRRQRQSMDMLLGITPPLISNLEQREYKTIKEQESPLRSNEYAYKTQLNQYDLDDVVSDFEKTLQRSKNKLSNNLPDVTAVSASSLAVLPSTNDVSVGKDFDSVSIESCGLSPAALQNIREQMALSLERTRLLEDRISIIPILQAQSATLKEENRQLLLQLQNTDTTKLNIINANYIDATCYSRIRSHSLTAVDSIDKREVPPPPPRRNFGVMCGVLTRNIGVGNQNPNTRSVSTTTTPCDNLPSNWYSERYKFLNDNNLNNCIKETKHMNTVVISKGTQTRLAKERKEGSTQTLNTKPKELRELGIQATENKTYQSIGVHVQPLCNQMGIQSTVAKVSLGVSDDTVQDEYCTKCKVSQRTVGVGHENNLDSTTPISLATLTSVSKSFNISSQTRTIGCQYEVNHLNKGCQYETKLISKSCQHEIKLANKAIQYESDAISKTTDTEDLAPTKNNVATETIQFENRKNTLDVGCNTVTETEKCTTEVNDEVGKEDKEGTPSRIPRLQLPTTPTENRKFKREDTKIPALIPASPTGLSALDFTTKSSTTISSLEKIKENLRFHSPFIPHQSSAPSTQNSVYSTYKENHECILPLHENAIYNSNTSAHRQKTMPSKELQAAMKVVNDALQKNQSKNLKNQMKSATTIIQQEWFKMSCSVNADPLEVEDYLDCFEEISYGLLEYVVNMVDASGNTAMHYAVSHGNFDVVSILLDSKVCDINKQNTAGYTSVMLVSLAEMRSNTHAHVVKRLFKLADVNIRAKQHGQTALMLAVSHGRLDMVQMLLEAGADINIQDEDGSTALMCAAEHGHIEIVKHFLSHPDCDSSLSDVDGSTALKIAMEASHRHIGVLLYAHDRNLHGSKNKKSKASTSSSPKMPSSPSLPI